MKSQAKILPTEKCDAVLSHLNDRKDVSSCFYWYRLPLTYRFSSKEITITQRELLHILEKLHRDGYLRMTLQGADGVQGDVKHYAINFDGEVFLQSGGYTQAYLKEKLLLKKAESLVRRQFIYDTILVIAAVAAAIGGCGLLIVELIALK
ncbi:hypothetical protein [Leeuwenhoekiella parthenopeia]|uniref:Uncharacterized protein n=1 Tax=Leeuwenhoekiella parthenopeia TaxID=2890320 RepID=A0ABS8GNP6_9FLAO|nr:hypothetical protein [Leeuwenhoekiella parthenopeia]MCC4211391.1 hypothetical protein [Leeuwenhoekiella parthenopeia]